MGKTSFWVFNKSQDVVVPGAASAEPHGQNVAAVPNDSIPEASAVGQTAITDFFSPRPSGSSVNVPVFDGVQSECVVGVHAFDPTRRVFAIPPFISPCPSVRLAEVPSVFHVQSDCHIENYLDHTSPLFERDVSKLSRMTPSAKPESSVTRTSSHNKSVSDSSDDGTLLGSAAQRSESSFPASPQIAKEEVASDNFCSSSEFATSELVGTSLVEDAKTEDTKPDIENTNTTSDEERTLGNANTETDRKSETRNLKLVHELAMEKMKEKLHQKDEVAKSATKFAEGAAAKLAAVLAKHPDAGADSMEVYQLTKRRDGLLKELESSRDKISDLTRSVQETREQMATALTQRDDTRTALAAAKAESTSAKAETAEAYALGNQLSNMTDIAKKELKSSNDTIDAILKGKGHEVIKGQNRLITFLRVENEDFEQQLHASSLENMSLRKSLKEGAKAAANDVAKNRQLVSSYKKEVQSCNTRILELEAKKLEFEIALQAGTGFVALAILLRDREQTIAGLTARVEEVAILHQKEIKYENHVIEIQTDLQFMYQANDRLVQEVSELKEEVKREKLDNESLQAKLKLFDSKALLMSRYNNICNKHAILNILMKEKLTLQKGCTVLQKQYATLVQRQQSKQDLRVLIYDLLHRIIRLSHALTSRGAYPFNAGYADIANRVFLVAQVDEEDVFAEANTDGGEHEFDTEWIGEDLDDVEEEDSCNEEHGKDRGDDGGNKDHDNVDEASGGSQEDNRGAPGERATPNDGDTPGEISEYNNGGSQGCENAGVITDNKEVGSTSKSSSGKCPVSSAPTPLAEEVETSTAVAGDLKEVPKSPETFNGKDRSVLDPSKGQNVAILPMVDNTSDNTDTELLSLPDMDNTHVDDVEYSNRAKKQARSMPPETLKASKAAGATSPSTAAKGNSQDIWKGISFAIAENKPFSFTATPAADLETKPNEKSPIFKSFLASEPAKAETPVSEHSEAKKGSGFRNAQQKVAPATTEKAGLPSQIQGFNFGEMGGPVSFTSSSPSFPFGVTDPASTGMFSFSGQNSPPATIQAKEKASEEGVLKDETFKVDASNDGALKDEVTKEEAPEKKTATEETPREEVSESDRPEVESPREKKQKQKMKEENAPKEGEIPEDAPAPSEPSRNQRRAAKKQQKEAKKKAEKEAKTANAQASKRVQQAMMMR